MIRCIAIDDEPLALKQMEKYIGMTQFLELVGLFSNGIEAMSFIEKHEPELLFVDINMPDLSGMELVKTLVEPPMIIFTTAYSEYAIEGFRVDALDYLLKPIAYGEFLRASKKAETRWQQDQDKQAKLSGNDDFLFIKSDAKVHRINLSDVLYIEGMREYVRIHLVNQKPLMPLISIKKLERNLPADRFMRVHRSYIVNLDKLSTIERNRIRFEDKIIPVSDQYKAAFQQYLDDNFLV